MPRWVIAAFVVVAIGGIASTAFVVSKCGAKGLLYGNGAVVVAASGACD